MISDNKKKIISLALTTLGFLTSHLLSTATLSVNIGEQEKLRAELKNKSKILKENLDSAKKNVTQEAEKKNNLDKQIKEMQEKIDASNNYINELSNKIEELKQHIKEIEEDIELKIELLKEALVSMYKAGDTSAIDIIVGAKDFSDFLDKADIIKSVSDTVQKIIDELNEQSALLEQQKATIEDIKKKQEEEKAKLEVDRQELQKLFDESEKLLAQYQESEKQAKREIDENDAEIKAINAQIERYYEEQRRKEEEAKKRNQNQNQKAVSSSVVNTGAFVWPVPGFHRISSDFYDCVNRSSMHRAIDIAGGGIYGANIVSAGDGQVILLNKNVNSRGQGGGGYGEFVVIDHGNGRSTLYGHMSGVAVSVGQKVSKGQVIGQVGNTGFSTGPHLHFEFRENGVKKNPVDYVGR